MGCCPIGRMGGEEGGGVRYPKKGIWGGEVGGFVAPKGDLGLGGEFGVFEAPKGDLGVWGGGLLPQKGDLGGGRWGVVTPKRGFGGWGGFVAPSPRTPTPPKIEIPIKPNRTPSPIIPRGNFRSHRAQHPVNPAMTSVPILTMGGRGAEGCADQWERGGVA